MILSITALAATFAPLLTDAQAAVNGAFKPLISVNCSKRQAMTAQDAFERCQQLNHHLNKIASSADEGLEHLNAVRSGVIDVRDFPEGFEFTLDSLAENATNSINLVRDMFSQAEGSDLWAGHLSMLKPIKSGMARNLAILRNSATQIATEIRQAKEIVNNAGLTNDGVTDEDVRRLIDTSHKMLGVDTPRWS
ncbi:hypothetical protein ABQ333_17515 [Serratia fonticola]|uniref:hypothetical protein n=1 Tax=Serratia fonticola TaxID=47917 RepID=UPI003AAEA90A